jgi:hypothetical protein
MFALSLILAAVANGADGPDQVKTEYRPELFRTLVDPDCSHCRDEAKRKAGALRDDDRALAWIRGDYDGGAIPYRWFLVPYRVISDTYGVFVYDADADFVRAWPASLDFRFHGWRNGVMVMKHKDGTIFDCLTGVAVEGPRQGERLQPLPALETKWGPWLKEHPGTVAYQMVDKFVPLAIPKAVSEESRATRPKPDSRLDPEARVFGLAIGSVSKAWPVSGFKPGRMTLSERLGEQEVVILWNSYEGTAVAFAPETEGKTPMRVTLKIDSGDDADAPWVDEESGSRWSTVGRAVSGPRKGEALRWLPGVLVKWYAWAAEYPQTGIVPVVPPVRSGRE